MIGKARESSLSRGIKSKNPDDLPFHHWFFPVHLIPLSGVGQIFIFGLAKNRFMEDLAAKLSSRYRGNLVYSSARRVVNVDIEVVRLNHLLTKVQFELDGQTFIFRAMLSLQEEGILMVIQNRTTKNYILSGLSGFLFEKPNINGGFIQKLDALYFHVNIDFFDGRQVEVFFVGKEEGEFLTFHQEILQKHKLLL